MIISGIYKITNTVTGEFYVGSSKNVERRWQEHKCPGAIKKNPNSRMYQDMKRLGTDAFTFEVLETCEPLSLFEREKYWIETLKPTYNVGKVYAHNKQAVNPGIYKITNNITGDFYIGSSRNVKERFFRHRKRIQWKRFPNNPMYKDFQKYGLENFTFEMIVSVPEEALREKEQYYIELLKPTYNRVNAFMNEEDTKKRDLEKNKAYRKAHQDDIRAKKIKYYEANKEKLRAQKKAYREIHREELKARKKDYYEKNRERLLAKEQAWRDANREECRAKWNAYHSAHREERNAKRRANLSQKCIYNDEELTLNALFQRFRGRGITHAMLEAKKYLVTSENIPTE